MQILKFGGASIRNASAIRHIGGLIQGIQEQNTCPKLFVVSAMGKTTNALEAILKAKVADKREEAKALLAELRQSHEQTVEELFASEQADRKEETLAQLNDWFVEAEWCIEDEAHENYDYDYDQLVSLGEQFSSCIIANYFQSLGLPLQLFDVRDVFQSDNRHREAKLFWDETKASIQEQVAPLLQGNQMLVTQGFIASTSENFTTTLGREGSDYSAAVFAACLGAEELCVWKDVPGILSADPKKLPEYAKPLAQLSYSEAIEMTYNGAKVLHPKTLRPLEQAGIPLRVRSFLDRQAPGTIVSAQGPESYPPIYVLQPQVALWHLRSHDLHFLHTERQSKLLALAAEARVEVVFWQTRALTASLCLDAEERRLDIFRELLQDEYDIELQIPEVSLLCIRHPEQAPLEALEAGKNILLRQASDELLQWVFI